MTTAHPSGRDASHNHTDCQADNLLPLDAGQLVIADSKELDTARTVVRLIGGLAWRAGNWGWVALFTGIALAMAVVAVFGIPS